MLLALELGTGLSARQKDAKSDNGCTKEHRALPKNYLTLFGRELITGMAMKSRRIIYGQEGVLKSHVNFKR